jgi:hypothetical protein
MIGDSEGEIGRLIREHRCGTIITPGDAATLADTLRRWSEQPKPKWAPKRGKCWMPDLRGAEHSIGGAD